MSAQNYLRSDEPRLQITVRSLKKGKMAHDKVSNLAECSLPFLLSFKVLLYADAVD
jgi:hypothetical protein